MYTFKLLPVAMLAAITLPSGMAAKCAAVGTLTANSLKDSGSLEVRNEHKDLIYSGSDDPCTDLNTVHPKGLKDSFSWGASCETTKIKECHGAYGSQTHINGEKPSKDDQKFYGFGSLTSSSCMVKFDC